MSADEKAATVSDAAKEKAAAVSAAAEGTWGQGEKETGGGGDVLCNVYFSTMRAATDKRFSPVERVDQVDNG